MIHKTLARLTNRKKIQREKTSLTNIRNKRKILLAIFIAIKGILKEYIENCTPIN